MRKTTSILLSSIFTIAALSGCHVDTPEQTVHKISLIVPLVNAAYLACSQQPENFKSQPDMHENYYKARLTKILETADDSEIRRANDSGILFCLDKRLAKTHIGNHSIGVFYNADDARVLSLKDSGDESPDSISSGLRRLLSKLDDKAIPRNTIVFNSLDYCGKACFSQNWRTLQKQDHPELSVAPLLSITGP